MIWFAAGLIVGFVAGQLVSLLLILLVANTNRLPVEWPAEMSGKPKSLKDTAQ